MEVKYFVLYSKDNSSYLLSAKPSGYEEARKNAEKATKDSGIKHYIAAIIQEVEQKIIVTSLDSGYASDRA